MTIPYRILIGDPLNAREKEIVTNIIADTFDEVDRIYNKWNPSSEISRLNRLKAGVRVSISPEMEMLLTMTNEIVMLTDYRFDPTIEPLQAIWKKYLIENKIPPEEEIQAVAKSIGWNHIHFEKGIFYKDSDLVSLDLGGIAKGYCVDLLVKRLNEAHFKNVFVDWGGEIKAIGEHPQKRPWMIFISRLGDANPEQAIAIVPLSDQAIATSGDYLQNWSIKPIKTRVLDKQCSLFERDFLSGLKIFSTPIAGVLQARKNFSEQEEKILEEAHCLSKTRVRSEEDIIYYHIIDPVTLAPRISTKKSVASASVLAPSCAFADGLATAAMMFSNVQEAEQWSDRLKKFYPEIKFWLISRKD